MSKFDWNLCQKFLRQNHPERATKPCVDTIAFDVHDAREAIGFTICLAVGASSYTIHRWTLQLESLR